MKKFFFALIGIFLLSTSTQASTFTITDESTNAVSFIHVDDNLTDETLQIYLNEEFTFESSYLELKTNKIVDTYVMENKTLTVIYNLGFNNNCWWSTSNSTVSIIDITGPGAVVTYYDTNGNITKRYVTSDAAARDGCAMMK
jgi:hypothetical protein